MATTTPINGWSIPQLTDPPNITTAVNSFANAVDARANPIYSTTSARNAAIPSPTAGQECFVTGTGEKYIYTGSAWVGLAPRRQVKTGTNIVNNSTTLIDATDLSLSFEANVQYRLDCDIAIQSNTTPQFKFSWNVSGGGSITGFYKMFLLTQNTSNLSVILDAWGGTRGVNTDGTLQYMTFTGDFGSTVAGTIKFQFAQNVANVSNTSVFFNSSMLMLKTT